MLTPARTTTFSPRQQRVLTALLGTTGWIAREAIDRISGSSNGPDVIRQLREKLGGDDTIDTRLVEGIDRDGRPCKTGQYQLTAKGRERAMRLAGLEATHG